MQKLILALLVLAGLGHAQSLIVLSGSKTVTTDTGITFTPAAGAVTNPTTVTFSGAIAGSIYCSTQDGSTPATNLIGTACANGSLGNTTNITSAVTVKVVSGKLGDEDSPVSSAAYTIVSFNRYGYGFNTTTSTSATVNTVTADVASGNISVTNNDLLIGYGQGITASDTTVTMSSSPSTTWTAIAPNLTGTIEFGELSYASAASTSAAFNATFTTQTATLNIGGTVLDFTCGTCAFVTSYNFTPAATGTITITGISATAGAHGLLAVMCVDAGSSSRTWTVGTINGVTATIAGSSSATATTGAVACEYITSATSFSSASASITQSQPLQTPTATIAIWSY